MGSAGLLPPNATALESALAQTIAARLGALDAPLRELWNPQTCPVALLPWLAWSLAVESWDAGWPESVKRARVASAIAIHRHKGTLQAVEDVISAYGGNVQLTLWDEANPQAQPYTFSLLVALNGANSQAPTADFINGMIADISRAKSARDTFTFTVALNAVVSIGLIGAARPAVYARLECTQK